MSTSLTHDPIRELPIYRAGQRVGVDIGLRIALDALTAERGRQERVAAQHPDATLTYVYAAGRLLDVTRVVAARFRGYPIR